MKKPVSINSPGQLTVLAALLAGLCAARPWPPPISSSARYMAAAATPARVYRNDFIEMFNRGAPPVNLSGWSVQYASRRRHRSWAVTALPASTATWPVLCWCSKPAARGGTRDLPTRRRHRRH